LASFSTFFLMLNWIMSNIILCLFFLI
jgi:hypothetical protein